jgi:signal peptidase II
MKSNLSRWVLFLVIALVAVLGDLVTKGWAVNNLASPRHPLVLQIKPDEGGKPLTEVLQARLGAGVHLDAVLKLDAPLKVDPEALVKDCGVLKRNAGLLLLNPKSRAPWFVRNPYLDARRADNPDEAVLSLDGSLKDVTLGAFVASKGGVDQAKAEELIREGYLHPFPRMDLLDGGLKVAPDDRYLITQRNIPLVDGFLGLIYVENPGAAWGFLATAPEPVRRTFLGGVSLLAMILIFFMFRNLGPGRVLPSIYLGLILGGAAGNFVDRLVAGTVVDFVQMFLGSYEWPTYNVADIAISVGVGLVLLDSLLHREPKGSPKAA